MNANNGSVLAFLRASDLAHGAEDTHPNGPKMLDKVNADDQPEDSAWKGVRFWDLFPGAHP
ncbi:hypothetical protein TWF225_010779 [Orbilia oligospora]|uniref:Uncharacterized protein n=1 Tax=Orbilia oligospora TaxID=2813651 RepID=A0A7C8JRE1_ORBOL|nr:hypothetical protein TWF102_009140 [Orbilia oligospora]KAF3116953.1 hypothetical protein TWF706_000165 [Orbilia oligospora]KAF3140367.1 hypothetical protein TWF594_006337 [Orbilia oligospora]KAF3161485.1 hypothetical protein TWF751_011289 [Orbilia oligospora]KAF3170476.1 hypothetical protein TWF225_010779 [Orbilia oligospora]